MSPRIAKAVDFRLFLSFFCLFALFLIALWQACLSLVSGEVSVISGSFLPWRMVAYSLASLFQRICGHEKK